MSTLYTFKITGTGDGCEAVKDAFDGAVIPHEFLGEVSKSIFVLNFPDLDEFIAFQPQYGDGISVSSEVIIKGESRGQPPHDLVELLSEQFPSLLFELEHYDPLSGFFQRWHYEHGEFVLWDFARGNACEIEADDGYEAVYIHNGEQLADSPCCPLSPERTAALDARRTLFEQVTGEILFPSFDRVRFGTDNA